MAAFAPESQMRKGLVGRHPRCYPLHVIEKFFGLFCFIEKCVRTCLCAPRAQFARSKVCEHHYDAVQAHTPNSVQHSQT